MKLAHSFAESSMRNLVLDCEHDRIFTDGTGCLFRGQDHRTDQVEISCGTSSGHHGLGAPCGRAHSVAQRNCPRHGHSSRHGISHPIPRLVPTLRGRERDRAATSQTSEGRLMSTRSSATITATCGHEGQQNRNGLRP